MSLLDRSTIGNTFDDPRGVGILDLPTPTPPTKVGDARACTVEGVNSPREVDAPPATDEGQSDAPTELIME